MLNIGHPPLPLDIDIEAVLADGHALAVGDGATRFDFVYRDVGVACRLEQAEGQARLKLVADLGPMPFSAESTAARSGLTRIMEAANEALEAPRFRLAQGRMVLGGDLALEVPVTATDLVTVVVRFLLPAAPYLELISIYVRPPLAPARAGESAVRPEWRPARTSRTAKVSEGR